ncbi:MAG: hypothetical protein ACK5Q5_10435 [Planctomycetaceae bacterium]
MQIRPSNGVIALSAGLALAILLGPFLIHEDAATAARMQANRRAIADMTAAERQGLIRNYERWQGLSIAEQQQWRQFAQQLDAQRASLAPVMEDYYRWLETIPGYRRDDLRQARDIQAKIALVKEIAQDQLAERLDAPDAETLNVQGRELPILSSAELDQVIAAIEEGLLTAERNRLVDKNSEPLVGVERHLMVFSQLLGRYGGLRQMMENPAQRDRVQKSMPERLTELFQDRPGPQRAALAAASLGMSLRMELEQAFRAQRPTASELQQFYEQQLQPDEQEALLDFSAEDFQAELSRRYYRWQLEQRVTLDLPKVMRFIYQFGGPRGERPPDERAPFSRARPQMGVDGGRPFLDRNGFRRPGDRGGEGDPRRLERPRDGERPPRPEDGPPHPEDRPPPDGPPPGPPPR